MAQLNIYLSNDMAAHLKRQARRAGMPLSRFVLSLIEERRESEWPDGYFTNVCGFLKDEMPEPADRLPEPVDLPESRR